MVEDTVIISEGNEFIHESIHLEKLRSERPEALNWCNVMVGSVGNIQLWAAGEYYYWKITDLL